jgi:hypothetical protein
MKFRKKPVVIEAMRHNGQNNREILEWARSFPDYEEQSTRVNADGSSHLRIVTLEGEMYADVGDYVIRGVAGEFYPCKPDIFEATYDAVEDPEDATR